MSPKDRPNASVSLFASAASILRQESTGVLKAGVVTTTRGSTEDDYLVRHRVQKLRWLGLDQEADRLASALLERGAVGAPEEFPETD